MARFADEAVSVAPPAVEVTLAVVAALYSFVTPAVNAPKETGPPTVRATVAGTAPPTGAGASTWVTWTWIVFSVVIGVSDASPV